MRRGAIVAASLVAVVGKPAVAHDHAAMAGSAPWMVAAAVRAGTYASRLYEGSFRSGDLSAGWQAKRWTLGASLAAYQLTRNGAQVTGLGDAMLHVSARVWQHAAWSLQSSLMMSVPTSDGSNGLGMGHFMLMPSVAATWMHDDVTTTTVVHYGRALGDPGVHEAHGAWPLVDPMNGEELGAAVTVSARVVRHFFVNVGGNVAAPLPSTHGVTRASAEVGLMHRWRTLSVGASVKRGGLDHPLLTSGSVQMAASF